jgi:HAMP domain-containing protein
MPVLEDAIGHDVAESTVARATLAALTALKKGDFSVRLPLEWIGLSGKLADAFNEVVELNGRLARELARVSRVVGKEGKIAQRASIGNVSGSWADAIESVNALIGDLVHPTSETARVIGAVAQGDLSQTMDLEIDDRALQGEFLHTAKTINRMVDQLSSFASEVTRVAREVGTEGKLGGQAKVKGVAGTWKDLTDSVNSMASNLTGQVRNIAEVDTAVANGDLLANRSRWTCRANPRAEEHHQHDGGSASTASRRKSRAWRAKWAPRGKLGGQAKVRRRGRHVEGLTDTVNSMASNLTGQVRNIAEVTGRRRRRATSRTKITGGREGRNSRAEEHHQHDGGPTHGIRDEVTRVWRAKSARTASSAARRRRLASPARGRT